ncbi:MAG TPA: cardiolipin synthase, partial [Coprococcus sp.]|nr:cardiolipin synthase [Coprococcus sp.]
MKKLLNRLFSRMVITCLLVAAQLIFFMVEVLKLQQYYVLVAAILHLLSFIAVMHLLLKDVNPSIKLAWIVPILMFPVLGGLLYLLYGHIIMPKKLEKYMKHAAEWDYETDLYANMAYFSDVIKGQPPYRLFKYTEDYAGSLVYQNTDVRYYPMGEDVWPDFVDDLKSAKKYIFLEYFIINPGEMWNTVLEILKEKVKEGVEVRLIYDDIGSVFYVPKYYWRELESHGIKCMAFNQVVPFLATIFNNRDHRKIAVMDGKVAYTGGFNLSDEYINKKAPYGKWKDNGIRMEGDAAWRFTILFLQLWNSIRNEDKHILSYRPIEQKKHLNDGYLQPYTTNPLKKEPIGENIYMQMINDAREYVYIFTPYL